MPKKKEQSLLTPLGYYVLGRASMQNNNFYYDSFSPSPISVSSTPMLPSSPMHYPTITDISPGFIREYPAANLLNLNLITDFNKVVAPTPMLPKVHITPLPKVPELPQHLLKTAIPADPIDKNKPFVKNPLSRKSKRLSQKPKLYPE